MKIKKYRITFFTFFLVMLFCFIGKSDTDDDYKPSFKPVNI